MDEFSRDFIQRELALSEKIAQYKAYEKFDAAEMPAWSDKHLAGWQALHAQDSPQYLLAEHEWQRRLADRQIAAAHKANWRSVIGGIVGTLIGVIAGYWLSAEQSRRQEIPKTQSQTASQTSQQQPVTAPPPKQVPPTVTPSKQPATKEP